jgi:hypothetical protein
MMNKMAMRKLFVTFKRLPLEFTEPTLSDWGYSKAHGAAPRNHMGAATLGVPAFEPRLGCHVVITVSPLKNPVNICWNYNIDTATVPMACLCAINEMYWNIRRDTRRPMVH